MNFKIDILTLKAIANSDNCRSFSLLYNKYNIYIYIYIYIYIVLKTVTDEAIAIFL